MPTQMSEREKDVWILLQFYLADGMDDIRNRLLGPDAPIMQYVMPEIRWRLNQSDSLVKTLTGGWLDTGTPSEVNRTLGKTPMLALKDKLDILHLKHALEDGLLLPRLKMLVLPIHLILDIRILSQKLNHPGKDQIIHVTTQVHSGQSLSAVAADAGLQSLATMDFASEVYMSLTLKEFAELTYNTLANMNKLRSLYLYANDGQVPALPFDTNKMFACSEVTHLFFRIPQGVKFCKFSDRLVMSSVKRVEWTEANQLTPSFASIMKGFNRMESLTVTLDGLKIESTLTSVQLEQMENTSLETFCLVFSRVRTLEDPQQLKLARGLNKIGENNPGLAHLQVTCGNARPMPEPAVKYGTYQSPINGLFNVLMLDFEKFTQLRTLIGPEIFEIHHGFLNGKVVSIRHLICLCTRLEEVIVRYAECNAHELSRQMNYFYRPTRPNYAVKKFKAATRFTDSAILHRLMPNASIDLTCIS